VVAPAALVAGSAARVVQDLYWWSGDMRIWGRVADGAICELLHTDRGINELFHPDLQWVDVTDQEEVLEGWLWDGERARAPEGVPVADAASALKG
jgi:hypothetical protein